MIHIASAGDGGADAFLESLRDLKLQVTVLHPHADAVSRRDELGGFGRGAIDLDMPCFARRPGTGASFDDADSPDPCVNTHGLATGGGHS